MSRLPRIVVPDHPHHVTQCGNRRGRVFFEEGDYALYADPARSPQAANQIFLISDGDDITTTQRLQKAAVADRLLGNLQIDSSKARDRLGWKPVVTMDEQLATVVAEK